MHSPALEATTIALACMVFITSCARPAPAARVQQPHAARVDQARVTELDRLIVEVDRNLEATRGSLAQAEAFKQQVDQQLADFRAKAESLLEAGKAPAATEAGEPARPKNAVQTALAAFEARATHAQTLFQLRRAQVSAREARREKLELERQQARATRDDAGLQTRIDAAERKTVQANEEVTRLRRIEESAKATRDDALQRYRTAREGPSDTASNSAATDQEVAVSVP